MIILKWYSIIFISMFIIAAIIGLIKSKTDIEKKNNVCCIIFLFPILITLIVSG